MSQEGKLTNLILGIWMPYIVRKNLIVVFGEIQRSSGGQILKTFLTRHLDVESWAKFHTYYADALC